MQLACNFHATHPYSIYIIEYVRVVIMDEFSYEYECNEGRYDSILIYEMNQIILKLR